MTAATAVVSKWGVRTEAGCSSLLYAIYSGCSGATDSPFSSSRLILLMSANSFVIGLIAVAKRSVLEGIALSSYGYWGCCCELCGSGNIYGLGS